MLMLRLHYLGFFICVLLPGASLTPMDLNYAPGLAPDTGEGSSLEYAGRVGGLPSLAEAKRMDLQDLIILKPAARAPEKEHNHFNMLFRKHPKIAKLPFNNPEELSSHLTTIRTREIVCTNAKKAMTRHLHHFFRHDHFISPDQRKSMATEYKHVRTAINEANKVNRRLQSDDPEERDKYLAYKRKHNNTGKLRREARLAGAKNLFYYLKDTLEIPNDLTGTQLEEATRCFRDVYGTNWREAYATDIVQYMGDHRYSLAEVEKVKKVRYDQLSSEGSKLGEEGQNHDEEITTSLPMPMSEETVTHHQGIHPYGQGDLNSYLQSQSSSGQTSQETSIRSNLQTGFYDFFPPSYPPYTNVERQYGQDDGTLSNPYAEYYQRNIPTSPASQRAHSGIQYSSQVQGQASYYDPNGQGSGARF